MKVLRALAHAVTLALVGGLLVAAPASAGPVVDPAR